MAPNLLLAGGMFAILRTILRSGPTGAALIATTAMVLLLAATGFLDMMSFIITVGGALAVVRVTYPRERIASTCQYLTEALGTEVPADDVIATFRKLAGIHRVEGAPALERAAKTAIDPFLRRAVTLSLECRDEDELHEVLLAEARRHAADGEAARQVVLTLGRLFPAFGLIGTLIGLALLLRNLGDANVASIGPGLGIAVLTTLYGAVLSNVVMLPLAAKLQAYLGRRTMRLHMIIEGALLVHRSEFPSRVERVLRSYLDGPSRESAPRIVELAPYAA